MMPLEDPIGRTEFEGEPGEMQEIYEWRSALHQLRNNLSKKDGSV